VVAYGLERRDLSGVVALGVEEIYLGRKEVSDAGLLVR
jgi:hypothetical protein